MAQVVLLAGPSGCGKSTLARRSGLPVLELDHFYRDGDAPDMPHDPELGMVDWEDIDSWDLPGAMAALLQLCSQGRTEVPVYAKQIDKRTGSEPFDLEGADRFIAEGIFAADLVSLCRSAGILADAIVVTRSPWKNMLRRLTRDLQEGRKSPVALVRRGRALMEDEPAVVAYCIDRGCRPLDAEETLAALDHG